MLTLGGKDLYLVAAVQLVAQRYQLMVYLGSDAVAAQEGMYLEGEVECSTSGWHRDDFSLRGEDEDFRCIEVEFDSVEEVHRIRLRIVQNLLDGAQPVVQLVFILSIFATLLIFPVGCKSLFCHLVHAVGANLYLYPASLLTHQGNVESLVSVSFRMVQPVAQTVGMALVYLADGNIDIEAFVHLVGSALWSHDDANCKNIVDFIEGNVFVLHLVPDGIRALDTCLDLVIHTQLIQFLTDRSSELCKEGVALRFGICKLMLNVGILLWMVVAEAEVFQFGLDFVESESVGEWRIYI